MKQKLLSICFISIIFITVYGQDVTRNHDITIEDYLTQAFIQECTVSPDGKFAAYIEWRWDKQKDGRNRDLWVVNISSREILRLTNDMANETSPQWSPDSKWIYFVGHFKDEGANEPPRDGSSQVWKIKIDGSELTSVTRVPDGIDDYEIAEDGSALYYIISKEHMIDDWKELRSEYKGDLEFGHGIHQVSEVWKIDLKTWREKLLVDSDRYIRYFDVSPDGRRIAMISDPDEVLINHEGKSEVEIFDSKTGKREMLDNSAWRDNAPSPFGWLGSPAWSSDGKIFAFSIDYDGYPGEIHTVRFSDEGEVMIKELPRPEIVTIAGGFKWMPDKYELCILGEYKAREHVYAIDYNSGKARNLTPGDVVVEGFNFVGRKGDLIATQSTLTYYLDLVLYDTKGKSERLTNVNPHYDTWKLPQISIVQWKGAEGDMVEGILELPPDYEGGEPLPLVLNLHGGPTASEKYCFLFWIYGRAAFAAKGYAMFSPNYRGSTGYGDKFLTDLIGHENDYDVQDIMTGVDYLIEKGIADPERLGVMGWSNGGYLTNCLIATNRFKCASSGAGVLDMTMQWGEEDTPGHVVNYCMALPWENPDNYRKASPLYDLKPGITTAVLIHQGAEDPRVPATQSKALHRALYYYLDVPCELILYPGAQHGLSTYQHRLAKMKWDHAWFDKYLMGKE